MAGEAAHGIANQGLSPDLIALAGRGRRKAQRLLRDHTLQIVIAGDPVYLEQALAVAEFLAMTLAATGTANDGQILSQIMGIRPSIVVEAEIEPEKIARVGRGSIKAQRDLRDRMLQVAGSDAARLERAFAVAEILARMLAENGTPGDKSVLAGMLFQRVSLLSPTEGYAAYSAVEAVSWLQSAAHAGDPLAIAHLPQVFDAIPGDVLTAATLIAHPIAGNA